jgi:hypothetical protein
MPAIETELRPIEYFSSNFSWWHRRLACAAQAQACGYKNNHMNATWYETPLGMPEYRLVKPWGTLLRRA